MSVPNVNLYARHVISAVVRRSLDYAHPTRHLRIFTDFPQLESVQRLEQRGVNLVPRWALLARWPPQRFLFLCHDPVRPSLLGRLSVSEANIPGTTMQRLYTTPLSFQAPDKAGVILDERANRFYERDAPVGTFRLFAAVSPAGGLQLGSLVA